MKGETPAISFSSGFVYDGIADVVRVSRMCAPFTKTPMTTREDMYDVCIVSSLGPPGGMQKKYVNSRGLGEAIRIPAVLPCGGEMRCTGF